jgi:hypothetical protein
MAKVIEHLEAHYEVQDVQYGQVYRWYPERAIVKCNCCEIPALTAFRTTCAECGSVRSLTPGAL